MIKTTGILLFTMLLGYSVYEISKNYKKNKITSPVKILNYQKDNNIYSIEKSNNNKFKINLKQVVCLKDKCNENFIDKKEIKEEEDEENLISLFDEVFKNNSKSEKTVKDEDLSSEQLNQIEDILENNDLISELEYEIINDLDYNNEEYYERGYYYKIYSEYSICTIARGDHQIQDILLM